jgi:hypothetical protein
MNARQALLASAMLAGFLALGSAPASAQAVQFFAVLEGGSEVAGTTAATGDLNATGTASVMLGAAGQLCYSILVRNTDTPTAAHIHQANAGVAGPIVIPLTPPAAGNPGTSAACLTGQNTTTLNQIRLTPSRFYINVHTTAFPAGAVRGQLF